MGNLESAQHILGDVLEKDPRNAEAIAGWGRIEELMNAPDKAEAQYKKALAANPNNITALTYLAELKGKLGDYDSSRELYARIVKLDPSARWAKLAGEDAKHGTLIAEIKKKIEEKDEHGAEILFQQLLVEAPDNENYYLQAGLFYHRIKQYQKAIDIYLRGLKVNPDSTDLYAALGLVYLSKKDTADARQAFLKALKYDPQNTDALAGLGSVALLDKKTKKAESYIEAALAIDSNNVAALSSLGDLQMIEKQYPAAEETYAKLLKLRPQEKWIKLAHINAKFGPELDEIKDLIENDQIQEAADRYISLISQAPDNAFFYFGLGQMYFRLKEYSKAIDIDLKGLEVSPEENELLISLGYAYLFNNDYDNAKDVLSKALQIDEKNPETLAGLGRLAALEQNSEEAKELFRKALTISPINQSALTFYADLLMKEKRYSEAQEMVMRLRELLPSAEWVQRFFQDAEDGPVTDIARRFADRQQFEMAAELYLQLVEASPRDPSRYQPLGQMYVNMQEYYKGICVFQEGLEIDPGALYLWRSIAFTYILMSEYQTSQCILYYLIGEDPKDAEAWAGLGRIEALNGSMCLAEEYYAHALELAPDNITALSFLAALRSDQQYNVSALEIYSRLMELDCEAKWIRTGYHAQLNANFATLDSAAAYHEERQWDPTVHKWSAEYLVYGGKALINYPIRDDLVLWGRCADEFYVLKDLIAHTTIYSFDVQRLYIGGRWVYSPCLFIDLRAGLSNYSRYRRSTFRILEGTIGEPELTFTYHQPTERATLSFSSDADLIARDFNTDKAKLVGRYFIAGTYSRKILNRAWAGVEGDAFWYNDFVNNTSQRALGWFQWRPPIYSDNFLFRYHIKYQRFAKNIPDYYTYKDQIINHLQLTLEKSWRFCWAESFYTSLSYAHGWQDTRTRYSQIIVIAPTPGLPPLIWDDRQYNFLFGNIIYNCNQLQATLYADYYRDTEKYTMASVIGDIRWRF